MKEEARDLHLKTAEMRSELGRKRVEKSPINDDHDSRLIQRTGQRHDIMERHAEAVNSRVQQKNPIHLVQKTTGSVEVEWHDIHKESTRLRTIQSEI